MLVSVTERTRGGSPQGADLVRQALGHYLAGKEGGGQELGPVQRAGAVGWRDWAPPAGGGGESWGASRRRGKSAWSI